MFMWSWYIRYILFYTYWHRYISLLSDFYRVCGLVLWNHKTGEVYCFQAVLSASRGYFDSAIYLCKSFKVITVAYWHVKGFVIYFFKYIYMCVWESAYCVCDCFIALYVPSFIIESYGWCEATNVAISSIFSPSNPFSHQECDACSFQNCFVCQNMNIYSFIFTLY